MGRQKSPIPLTKQQLIKTTPELIKELKKIVHMKRTTTNGLLNQIIIEYVQNNQELIQQYNQIYNEL